VAATRHGQRRALPFERCDVLIDSNNGSGSSGQRYEMRRRSDTVAQMPARRTGPDAEIRLLGSPEIIVHGRPLKVDTRKAVAILAVLATDGRPYGREELATLLWPDSDDAAARGALRRTLSVLRGAVGANVLHVDRRLVALDKATVAIDVARLDQLGASNRAADLAAAAELARGPFMAGFSLRDSAEFDDWRAARAVAVERTVARVLDGLIEMLEAGGDLGGAIAAAGRRIDHDPLDEGAHVRRMELLAKAGDRAGAIRQYRSCVAVLERELGVEPLPETTARYEAIRDGHVLGPPTAAEPDAPATPVPALDPERLPIVGRESALRLAESARQAIRGDGRVLVISGEPGIGKSRVAHALGERARSAGAVVIATAAYAAEQRIAYGPIVDALESAIREPDAAARIRALGDGVNTELARIVPGLSSGAGRRTADVVEARLLAAIADALTAAVAGSTAGVLVVDDVHWVDGATAAALAYLLRRLTGRPILVVLAWRGEDLSGDARQLAELAESLADAGVFRLSRLSREDVEAMVRQTDAPQRWSVDALWEASEGLPLYLASALASPPDGVPAGSPALPGGVRAVLTERLDAVGGVAAQVLAAAAAIGRAFEVPTLRYASGRTDDEVVDALDELSARGLIREAGEANGAPVYDFTHGALRDLAEASSSLARRRLLHRRIAESLRIDGGGAGREDPARLARIARHEREAGRDAEAASAFRDAGEAAAGVYANLEAIDAYEAALALGHPSQTELYVRIGDLRTRIGDYTGAVRAYEAAAALAGSDDETRIEAALARSHLRAGDLAAAEAHLEAALAGLPDAAWRATCMTDRAVIRRRGGDRQGAARAAAEAAAAAEESGDPGVMGAARRMAGLVALDAGEAAVAVVHLEAAVNAAADDADPSASIAALTGLALALAAAGEVDAALDRGQGAVAICRRIGDRHLEAAVENHLADLLHEAGRDDEAMEHLRRSVEAFAEFDGDPADPDPGVWMLWAS
jgi:DNA-binding SARP family transcriptional activator/tetratricopeptide (TPR) repeat protein